MQFNTVSLAHLSDDKLLVRVKELVHKDRAVTTELLVHLAEMEERRLYCREGCSSLFTYCVEVLHLSEPAAYRRIKAARLARRFPVVLEMLAEGSIHLAALDVLAPHLTDANHRALLGEATHKTKRQVEELAARLRPLPDAPPTVRRLPEPNPVEAETKPEHAPGEPSLGPIQPGLEPARIEAAPVESPHESTRTPLPDPNPAHRPVVAPLSPARYRIQFTADADTYRKLRQVQELLRHRVPDGDPSAIVDAALTLLLEKLLRERTGKTTRPRRKKGARRKSGEGQRHQPTPGTGEALREKLSATESGNARQARVASSKPSESRYIPADVKRAVWRRDQGRCAYTAQGGRRCSERGQLEFHHVEPYALGGRATVGNISLRCRAHNAYEGMLVFGERQPCIAGRQCLETLPGESSGVSASGIGAERRATGGVSSGGAAP
jgi:5-methylcytosine-specific restriction endonuclease McrA